MRWCLWSVVRRSDLRVACIWRASYRDNRGPHTRTDVWSSCACACVLVQALHSPIGRSDGEAYKHLYNAVVTAPGALSRPDWWREYVVGAGNGEGEGEA